MNVRVGLLFIRAQAHKLDTMKKFFVKVTKYRNVNPHCLIEDNYYAEYGYAALDMAIKDHPFIETGHNIYVLPDDIEIPVLNTPESYSYRLIGIV